jgi:hypothetical protein
MTMPGDRMEPLNTPAEQEVLAAALAWAEADAQIYPVAEETAGPMLDRLMEAAHVYRTECRRGE